MNDLEKYFRQNDKRLIHKWVHYFEIYENHFKRFRNKEIVLLEIGVSQGGSLQMWKDYFGPRAKIYGVDIDPRCQALEEENIKIFIGSQSDRKFLKHVKSQLPPIDILIDDGGHTMTQQIATFEVLYDHVKDTGVYFCEDVHTSYWITHGGGVRRRGTFIEFSKKLVDRLNAFHSEQRRLKVNEFTTSADSIHFYDSIVVIEKKKRGKPYTEKTGSMSFQRPEETRLIKKISLVTSKLFLRAVNELLRFFRLPGIIWR